MRGGSKGPHGTGDRAGPCLCAEQTAWHWTFGRPRCAACYEVRRLVRQGPRPAAGTWNPRAHRGGGHHKEGGRRAPGSGRTPGLAGPDPCMGSSSLPFDPLTDTLNVPQQRGRGMRGQACGCGPRARTKHPREPSGAACTVTCSLGRLHKARGPHTWLKRAAAPCLLVRSPAPCPMLPLHQPQGEAHRLTLPPSSTGDSLPKASTKLVAGRAHPSYQIRQPWLLPANTCRQGEGLRLSGTAGSSRRPPERGGRGERHIES